jgi:HPt (histidine-containing phosphotransfer) domain-containing protein
MKYKKFGANMMNNDLQEKLKELRKEYLNKLKDTFPNFKVLLNNNPIDIQEVYSKAHTIAGTSGMYGLKDLSEVSSKFEFYLKPLKANPDTINIEELKNKFSTYLNDLETILLKGE